MYKSDSLTHYGVLGMRWGRRKTGASSSGASSSRASPDHKNIVRIKSKTLPELSNDEIRQLATRLELENKYRQLNPGKLSKGKRAVDSIFKGIGAFSVGATAVTGAIIAGKKLYEEVKKIKV